MNHIFADFTIFLFFILVGTLYYGFLEQCTCSYGKTEIEGCVPEECATNGGAAKTFTDSFYMCVTPSTVGVGDETALSEGGRGFACVWIFFGVGAMVNDHGTGGQMGT